MGGPPWPQECTAQAFAWLDHCIDTNKMFAQTVVKRLNATTDKRVKSWGQVSQHMTKYAKRQLSNQTSQSIKSKLEGPPMKIMDNLLNEGSSIVPNLTGDTPMANLIVGIKSSLAEPNVAGAPEVKVEDEEDDQDQVGNSVEDAIMILDDDEETEVQSSSDESSQSEYMGSKPRKQGAAGPSTRRNFRKRPQQSSPVQLPSPKRARLATQSHQSRTLDEDELSVEEPSHEGSVKKFLRPILPAKAPRPRRSIEQHQERPHSAQITASKPQPEAGLQEPEEGGSPQRLRPVAIKPTPPRKIRTQGLEQEENFPTFHRAMTVPETPPGGPIAEQKSELQQENNQARSTVAPGSRVFQPQKHGAGGPERNRLVQENARVWQMYSEEKNKTLAQMHVSSSLRMILSSPANNEQLLRTKYQRLVDKFKTQSKMEDDLEEAENGMPRLSDADLASRFNDLQLAILDACHPFSLSNLEQTLTASGNDTIRDKKIKLLTQTAFTHGARALRIKDDEDVDFFRGFVTAHIFHFVCESDFPSRYTGHDSSPLLTEYRNICFEQEGAKALYAKERVAMKNYLKEKQIYHVEEKKPFHDLVEVKAKTLAREMADLLAPLSAPANIVADCFTPIYVTALKLKADMVMSNKNYTARFIPAGEDMDAESMTFENDFDKPNAKKVKQCVFPIIYAKPRPTIDTVDTELSECLIHYKNFAVTEPRYGRRLGSEGETMLYKGSMIL